MSGIIFICIIAALSAPSLYRMFKYRPRSGPEDIELTSIRNAMIEKYGWTVDRAHAAQAEYIRFLTLLQMKPGFMLVPWLDPQGRDDLDQFWHQHILDTAKYAADCKTLFRRMIHHNPHLLRGSEQETDAAEKTKRLYTRTFDSGYFGSEADSTSYHSCGACAATDTASDGSHSGHDGGSGSHGGHSCGGHSCGGHGCGGHGCGGH